MPSLPAVMNELMSYTVTPTRVVSLLASVSPAPQAVMPSASNPAEPMTPNFVDSLIYSLLLISLVTQCANDGLWLLLSRNPLVGDVTGLEVLGGQRTEAVEELLPVGDDVLHG